MTIIDALITARTLHGEPVERPGTADYPEYSRGQADLIGEMYGFSSDDKELIEQVVRQQMSIAQFVTTMLRQGWVYNSDPSERQRQTTAEMETWLESPHQRQPDRQTRKPPRSPAEEVAEQIDAYAAAHGYQWRVELAAASECFWECKATMVLTPNRGEGPDRSLITMATGGNGPEDVMRSAWEDLQAWLGQLGKRTEAVKAARHRLAERAERAAAATPGYDPAAALGDLVAVGEQQPLTGVIARDLLRNLGLGEGTDTDAIGQAIRDTIRAAVELRTSA
jgi:hypothetical protein